MELHSEYTEHPVCVYSLFQEMLKFYMQGDGVPFAMMNGIKLKLMLYAINLDSKMVHSNTPPMAISDLPNVS